MHLARGEQAPLLSSLNTLWPRCLLGPAGAQNPSATELPFLVLTGMGSQQEWGSEASWAPLTEPVPFILE